MKYLVNLLLAIVAVFAPIKAQIITCLVLVLADLLTGVMAARKRKEAITSAGFRRTVVKVFVYEAALMLGFLTETYLTGAIIPVTKIVTTLIGISEFKSVAENLNEISGGNLLKILVDKLQSVNNIPSSK